MRCCRSAGLMQVPVFVTLKGEGVGHLLTVVSLPDHVLPAGLTEVHSEVFGVPWRVGC